MNKKICIHCYVSGKVQGVWYRASTQEQAEKLGITGFARNLADGRVEVMACGAADKIQLLHQWLKVGPPNANVTDVSYEEVPEQSFENFTTR